MCVHLQAALNNDCRTRTAFSSCKYRAGGSSRHVAPSSIPYRASVRRCDRDDVVGSLTYTCADSFSTQSTCDTGFHTSSGRLNFMVLKSSLYSLSKHTVSTCRSRHLAWFHYPCLGEWAIRVCSGRSPRNDEVCAVLPTSRSWVFQIPIWMSNSMSLNKLALMYVLLPGLGVKGDVGRSWKLHVDDFSFAFLSTARTAIS